MLSAVVGGVRSSVLNTVTVEGLIKVSSLGFFDNVPFAYPKVLVSTMVFDFLCPLMEFCFVATVCR